MNEVKQIGNIVDTGNWDNPQRGRIYSADGICPALNTVGGGGLEPKIIEDFYKNREPRVYDETAPTIRAEREGLKVIEEQPVIIGGMQKNQSVKTDGICTTLTSSMGTGGGYVPMVVASRGRNKENPSDRTQGIELEQRLEPNSDGICNTLTSVQKDNLVLEQNKTYLENAIEQIIEKNNGEIPEAWDLYNKNPINTGIAKTLSTDCGHIGTAGATAVTHNYRIRKLTPKECSNLMGFSKEDAEKMLEVNSNTQVYKQCGNSIVVDVLEAIFKQML